MNQRCDAPPFLIGLVRLVHLLQNRWTLGLPANYFVARRCHADIHPLFLDQAPILLGPAKETITQKIEAVITS